MAVQLVSLSVMASAHLFPQIHKLLLTLGMAGLGIGKANMFLIFLLAMENIDVNEHPTAASILYGLALLGDVIGLMMSLLFVYDLGWNWSANFMLYNGFYLVSSVLLHLVLKEV